jgi:hypothetical protein
MSDTLTAAALASDSRKMQHSRASDSAASLANLSLKAGTQGASRPNPGPHLPSRCCGHWRLRAGG